MAARAATVILSVSQVPASPRRSPRRSGTNLQLGERTHLSLALEIPCRFSVLKQWAVALRSSSSSWCRTQSRSLPVEVTRGDPMPRSRGWHCAMANAWWGLEISRGDKRSQKGQRDSKSRRLLCGASRLSPLDTRGNESQSSGQSGSDLMLSVRFQAAKPRGNGSGWVASLLKIKLLHLC